jgi:hypothetical protein
MTSRRSYDEEPQSYDLACRARAATGGTFRKTEAVGTTRSGTSSAIRPPDPTTADFFHTIKHMHSTFSFGFETGFVTRLSISIQPTSQTFPVFHRYQSANSELIS